MLRTCVFSSDVRGHHLPVCLWSVHQPHHDPSGQEAVSKAPKSPVGRPTRAERYAIDSLARQRIHGELPAHAHSLDHVRRKELTPHTLMPLHGIHNLRHHFVVGATVVHDLGIGGQGIDTVGQQHGEDLPFGVQTHLRTCVPVDRQCCNVSV